MTKYKLGAFIEHQTYAQRLAERADALEEIARGMCGSNHLAIMELIVTLRTLARDMEHSRG